MELFIVCFIIGVIGYFTKAGGYKDEIEKFGNITLINGDCMEFMQSQSDKSFDLAIVDPPYGLGKRTVEGGGKNTQIRFISDLKRTNWDDEVPSKEYFEE